MGNLLRVLYKSDENYTEKVDIFVDFENAKPTESEMVVWDVVSGVLDQSASIIEELLSYTGAVEAIRTAISSPHDEASQVKAWQVLVPLVVKLRRCFEFSHIVEKVVVQLLDKLCSAEMSPREHLETQQALFKQFAEILDFVFKFDEIKMNNPAIQNDFSYFRRMLGRAQNNEDILRDTGVSSSIANQMSLFYAQSTPMLHMLSTVTSNFVSERTNLPLENTTDCLSTMANICCTMIENPNYRSKFQNEETELFCMRVMVGVIILYDHVHPVGAFSKGSSIDVRRCIKVLKSAPSVQLEALLNALRYTTKHLNDEATPKAVRQMLA